MYNTRTFLLNIPAFLTVIDLETARDKISCDKACHVYVYTINITILFILA